MTNRTVYALQNEKGEYLCLIQEQDYVLEGHFTYFLDSAEKFDTPKEALDFAVSMNTKGETPDGEFKIYTFNNEKAVGYAAVIPSRIGYTEKFTAEQLEGQY